MILADTSVWADHIRASDPIMAQLLTDHRIRMHPFVMGELAMGGLPDRADFLRRLGDMLFAPKAADEEVMRLIERGRHHASGLGWVDMHLLASVLLADDLLLWTRDRRLNAAAAKYGRAAEVHH